MLNKKFDSKTNLKIEDDNPKQLDCIVHKYRSVNVKNEI